MTLSNVFGSQYVTATDANGVFSLANIPADLYTVTVQKEGYYDLIVVPFTKADYLDAEFNVVALGEFELSAVETKTITGTVKNVATRSAAAGVTVDVNGVTATTDATGAFTAQNVGASADGTVTGVKSVSPGMTLVTDTDGVLIECSYLRDIDRYIDTLTGGDG